MIYVEEMKDCDNCDTNFLCKNCFTKTELVSKMEKAMKQFTEKEEEYTDNQLIQVALEAIIKKGE